MPIPPRPPSACFVTGPKKSSPCSIGKRPARHVKRFSALVDKSPSSPRLADAPAEANTFVVGIAPPGGKIPPQWRPIILDAISRKLTIVSGLHDFLCDDRRIPSRRPTGMASN